MRKEAILGIVIVGIIWTFSIAFFLGQPAKKVQTFKEVNTSTLEEVKIKKISEVLPAGLYEIKVNDSLSVLVYSESHGISMIRIK